MGKGNAGGALRGLARAMAVASKKATGLYERASAPGKPQGVPIGDGAPKGKGRKSY